MYILYIISLISASVIFLNYIYNIPKNKLKNRSNLKDLIKRYDQHKAYAEDDTIELPTDLLVSGIKNYQTWNIFALNYYKNILENDYFMYLSDQVCIDKNAKNN